MVEVNVDRINQDARRELPPRMGRAHFIKAMLLTVGAVFVSGSPVVIDGKPFGYPPECRNNAPCDPEQDPLTPAPTPSDQLPPGSQPA